MIHKTDIPRALRITPHKRLIALRSLILRVPCQHALDTHAHALNILHRAPARVAEEVEADDAIRVDVRVDGNVADEGGGFGGGVAVCLWGWGCNRGGGSRVLGGCEWRAGWEDAEENDFGWFYGRC